MPAIGDRNHDRTLPPDSPSSQAVTLTKPIKVLLQIHGLDVEDFGSTSEFVSHYRKPTRGCLILDHHLPRTTGLDFLSSSEGRRLNIPVILITGHQGDPNIERRTREAGVAEYLQKPIAARKLIETVERVIDG
jgi:FixJ family two-component response regulator